MQTDYLSGSPLAWAISRATPRLSKAKETPQLSQTLGPAPNQLLKNETKQPCLTTEQQALGCPKAAPHPASELPAGSSRSTATSSVHVCITHYRAVSFPHAIARFQTRRAVCANCLT